MNENWAALLAWSSVLCLFWCIVLSLVLASAHLKSTGLELMAVLLGLIGLSAAILSAGFLSPSIPQTVYAVVGPLGNFASVFSMFWAMRESRKAREGNKDLLDEIKKKHDAFLEGQRINLVGLRLNIEIARQGRELPPELEAEVRGFKADVKEYLLRHER